MPSATPGSWWTQRSPEKYRDRAAAMYSLIVTAKLNDTDPRAWLADVLRRINDHRGPHRTDTNDLGHD